MRVLDEHGSRVEAHGLVVQDGRGEDRQVVELQPRRGIGDQCEAGGMGLREAIERKRADGADDLFLRMGVNVVGTFGSLCVRRLLPRARPAGDPRRLEQLPQHDQRA